MKALAETLGVARSNLYDRRSGKTLARGRYRKARGCRDRAENHRLGHGPTDLLRNPIHSGHLIRFVSGH